MVNSCIGNKRVNALDIDNTNKMWIGTINEGLFILGKKNDGTLDVQNYKKGNQASNGFYADFVNSFYKDKQNVIWIGTTQGGLVKMVSQVVKSRTFSAKITIR